MLKYVAKEGKVFQRIGADTPLGNTLILGKNDSIDNYLEVDELPQEEQERQEKEAMLRQLMKELYPADSVE